jgi:phospholipid/cholesterol/gamma-HCH transport system permease protein
MSALLRLAALAREETLTFLAVLGRATLGLSRRRWRRGEVVRQMHEVGNRSLLFVCVTLGFIGMVLVFQTCLQVMHITGDLSQVGAEFIKILMHEFGPSLTGMMLATRVGAGIAAEIGSMVVTEQVDALGMCNVDPVDYLVVPRLAASLVMTPVLAVFGVVSALALGSLVARTSFQVNPHVFFDLSRVTAADVATGLLKCVAYGVAIPVVSAHAGLRAAGGSEGVGRATTRAVLSASFAVIVLDFVISGVAMLTLQAPR